MTPWLAGGRGEVSHHPLLRPKRHPTSRPSKRHRHCLRRPCRETLTSRSLVSENQVLSNYKLPTSLERRRSRMWPMRRLIVPHSSPCPEEGDSTAAMHHRRRAAVQHFGVMLDWRTRVHVRLQPAQSDRRYTFHMAKSVHPTGSTSNNRTVGADPSPSGATSCPSIWRRPPPLVAGRLWRGRSGLCSG